MLLVSKLNRHLIGVYGVTLLLLNDYIISDAMSSSFETFGMHACNESKQS